MAICLWCANNYRDVCFEACQPERNYRYLVPQPPSEWHLRFSPPPFRKVVDLPAAERLALLWLMVYYLDQENKDDQGYR